MDIATPGIITFYLDGNRSFGKEILQDVFLLITENYNRIF